MDLPTHFTFGMAVGLVFFGRPEITLLIALGTLLPDLDREYWFIPRRTYMDEQLHRAALHNVFVMALAYLVSPYLSIGVFLHALQDSFTTVKDRGVEWFWPITRLVKRGLYDVDGQPMPLDPKEHVYFYQEDPTGLVDHAADIPPQDEEPVPWRRVYGPAQNSQLLDRGFLLGSISIIVIYLVNPFGVSRLFPFLSYLASNCALLGTGFLWLIVLFFSGELDMRDRPLRLPQYNFVKYPLFALGLGILATWLALCKDSISSNLRSIFSDPVSIQAGVLLIALVSIVVILWQTRAGKDAVV